MLQDHKKENLKCHGLKKTFFKAHVLRDDRILKNKKKVKTNIYK